MMRRFVWLMILLLAGFSLSARSEVRIDVTDQASFDRLPKDLAEALKSDGTDVVVDFRKGVYRFRENHLCLKDLYLPGKRITLQCNEAVFLAEGPDYQLKSLNFRTYSAPAKGPFDYKMGFVDLNTLQNVDMRGPVREALSRPSIVDKARGLCRIKVDERDLPASAHEGVYILLSQWYRGIVYPVDKIEKGYLYFRSPKLTGDGNAETDPDADYKTLKERPHYILYNHPDGMHDFHMTKTEVRSKGSRRLHQSEVTTFLTVRNSLMGAFTIQGGTFLANHARGGCLIHFDGLVSTETAIRNCRFDGIRSDIVRVHRSTNFLFCDNVVTRSYRRCIALDHFTSGAEIRDNRFVDTGYMMDHDFCIESQAGGLWIHHNVFTDFSYGAIGVGSHYMESIPASAEGVIEENEFFCTDAFLARPARLLMDSGAVYTWTINKDITIRNNSIHDIGGYGWNRGIFCDDGTVNVKIIGNRINRIMNSYCIDLRLCTSVERHPLSQIRRVNVGNRMEDNQVDGKVRFQNRDE